MGRRKEGERVYSEGHFNTTGPEKDIIQKDTCTPMFIAALFTIAKTWKQPKCPLTDEWIKKMWCVCVCVCILQFYFNCINKVSV